MNVKLTPKLALLFSFLLTFQSVEAQWVEWTDATSDWSDIGVDTEEKDIAIGDLDNDGRDDIVVVRKNPFSNPGARQDLLLMNTGSNLEDQTAIYAPGFINHPSDSRDVFIGDFDNDDWLDVVIANTFEDQPNFYHNLGEDADGNWLGLEEQSTERFPVVLPNDPLQFCALWAGDINGDDALDLYFSNYNPTGGSFDVLLVNDGNGFFTDETVARMGNLRNSAFGTSAEIHDMDNDGDQDIVKISTLYNIAPWNSRGVFLLFNDGTGNFSEWQKLPSDAPYMFTVGDFNNDNLKDVYVVDDNQDYINMATAVTPDMAISFNSVTIPDARANFFGGNVKLADLDNNNFIDIGLADVDVDIPPCESGTGAVRKFTLMQNSSGTISAPYGLSLNPWNQSTYDFAFLDLNGDDLPDIFAGQCSGYQIFLNTVAADVCPVEINGTLQVCSGTSTTLTASPGFASYNWSINDTQQSITVAQAGTYCVTATDNDGCEDATCVVVSVGASSSTDIDATICEGEPYMVGNQEFDMTGMYEVVLTSSNGCDSIINLTLTVLPAQVTDLITQICEGQSLVVGDSVYTETGLYLNLLQTQDGCDSLIFTDLTVLSNSSSQLNETICEGESITIGNEFFNETGIYEITLEAANGCDSILTLILTVLPSGESFIDAQICAGETYEVGGMSFDQSGDYEIILVDGNGCDSTINLALTVLEAIETNLQEEICAGEEYEIGDQIFTETGMYQVDLISANGCDSLINLNLTVYPNEEVLVEAFICPGESYDFEGVILTDPGEYEAMLSTQAGCDSLITLNLQLLENSETNVEAVICDGDSYSVGDMVFEIGGEYTIDLVASNGCDSTFNLMLTVLEASITNLSETICEGEEITIGDMVFTQEGEYEIILSDQNGCDSIIFLNLTVLDASTVELDELICEGDTYTVGDIVFDMTGMYEITLVGENGCDSTILLDLTVYEAVNEIIETLCPGDSLIVNDIVYNEDNPSGGQVFEGASVFGCDSIFIIDLIFSPPIILTDTLITPDDGSGNGSIFPEISGGTLPLSFEWLQGDTTQNLENLSTNLYTLRVEDAVGCVMFYEFFVDMITSTENSLIILPKVEVFPNPTKGQVQFKLTNVPIGEKQIRIFDILGREVLQTNFDGDQLNVNLPEMAGTYFYSIKYDQTEISSGKLIKI